MAARRYVIIGDGAAGTTAAQTLRQVDAAASITVVSDDPHPSYYRAALTNYLLGELRDDQVWAVPPTFYPEHRIARVLGRVVGVDTGRSVVHLASGGAVIPYDALLIASGARARPPTFEGADLHGVATLRTLQDVRAVMDRITLQSLSRAVVIGGGPLALEWALALRERRVQSTLLVREDRFLVGALDAVASDLLSARIRQSGVEVRLADEVRAAQAGPTGTVARVITARGQTIPCELVAAAIGVVCNTDFLAGSGVRLGPRGGVTVDDRLRSSAPNLFAAGDVAEHGGVLSQKWEPARVQGQIAAQNMAGADRAYAPGVEYFATRLYDLDFASVGVVSGPPGSEEIVDRARQSGRIAYRKIVIHGGRLIGALMLGEREEKVRRRGKQMKRLVDLGADVSSIKKDLLDPGFDLNGWLRTRAPVERIDPRRAVSGLPASAELRGTRVLKLAGVIPRPAPAAAAPAGIAPVPAAPIAVAPGGASPGAPASHVMLSIGLRVPAELLAEARQRGAGPVPWIEGAGRRWELSGPVVAIGRPATGQIALDDRNVSHVHAQITRHGEAFYLRDLGSRNGTWINGAQLVVPHALRDGDRIRLGGTDLLFRDGAGGARAPSAPGPTPGAAPPAAAAAATAIEVRAGANLGLVFALAGKSVTVGRDPASQVRLDDVAVSRRHAVLNEFGGRWHVSDLHSSRGTFRNGVRLPPGEDVPLEVGDQIVVGDTMLVVR